MQYRLKQYKREKESGITLIALVITIVVLLILAGVTIGTLTGNSGIIIQAQNAKENTQYQQWNEMIDIAILNTESQHRDPTMDDIIEELKNKDIIDNETQVDRKTGTITTNEPSYVIEDKLSDYIEFSPGMVASKNEKYKSDGKIAIIPKGFRIDETESSIDNGLVVYGPDDSEFIWIPVADIDSMAQCSKAGGNCDLGLVDGQLKCKTHDSTEIVGKLYATSMGEKFGDANKTYDPNSGMREPASVTTYDNNPEYNTVGLTLEGLKKEYKDMAESVAKYGGFYIGRYESSLSDATEYSAGKNGSIQSKKGVLVTRASDESTRTWYGLYAKQKEYTGKDNSVGSSMIWGSQYDAMLNWVINSDSSDKEKVRATGNAAHDLDAIYPAGKQTVNGKYDRINNIYDLEGNVYEWTLEAYASTSRAYRGGFCYASNSPSFRDYNGSRYNINTTGSRMTLYIK